MRTSALPTPLHHDVPRDALLRKALALALEVEGLLERAVKDDKSFRLRLARAQALSTIDALTDLANESSGGASGMKSGVYAIERQVGDSGHPEVRPAHVAVR